MEKAVLSTEEIMNGMNTGDPKKDLDMVNTVLSQNYELKSNGDKSVIAEDVVNNSVEQNAVDTTSDNQVLNDNNAVQEKELEIERQRKYNELTEQRRKEEYDKYLKNLQDKENQIVSEKRAKEELQNKLQQLQELQNRQPDSSSNSSEKLDEEDETYVSEYTKKTRQMVEELRASVGAANPVVTELTEKISKIEQEYNREKSERQKFEEQKKQEAEDQKTYDTIRQLQSKYSDLKTNKDIKTIEDEYLRFRKDMAFLVKAKNHLDLEKAISDYFGNGVTKKQADENGIKFPDEYDKYKRIVELHDTRRGIRYDPVIGKEIPILDDTGKQVRYRSLEEAYRVLNFDEEVTKQKRQAYRDTSRKLEEINSNPSTLDVTETEQFQTGISPEQENEILNWSPREYMRDPDKLKLVEMVYSKRGLEVPRYRGR